jgi:hypothetical protein
MKLKTMARPKKEYCDYFSHDRDMRNHRKIKALRTKYGIEGYAIWVMFLEFLTGNDNNIFEKTDIELELLSGDFAVSKTDISNVIDYCVKLGLLIENEGIVYSESLNERLQYVYNKRTKNKINSTDQQRINGKFIGNFENNGKIVSVTEMGQKVQNGTVNGSFCDRNPPETVVSVTEMPQSKVKEIKVNKESNNFKENSKIEEQNNLESTGTPAILNSNLFRQPKIPTKDQVWEVFSRAGGTKEMAKSFYEKHDATGWFINGSPITNWTSLANRFITNWRNLEESRKAPRVPETDNTKVKIKLK